MVWMQEKQFNSMFKQILSSALKNNDLEAREQNVLVKFLT